jgi:hypothetical protein
LYPEGSVKLKQDQICINRNWNMHLTQCHSSTAARPLLYWCDLNYFMAVKHHQTLVKLAYLLEQDLQYTYIKMLWFGTSLDVATKKSIALRPGNQTRPFNSELH